MSSFRFLFSSVNSLFFFSSSCVCADSGRHAQRHHAPPTVISPIISSPPLNNSLHLHLHYHLFYLYPVILSNPIVPDLLLGTNKDCCLWNSLSLLLTEPSQRFLAQGRLRGGSASGSTPRGTSIWCRLTSLHTVSTASLVTSSVNHGRGQQTVLCLSQDSKVVV